MRQRIGSPRTVVALNVGNTLELAGAGLGCYAVARLAGVAWALLAAGGLLVVAAELIYDGHTLRFPLPYRPRPVVRVRTATTTVWRRATAILGRFRGRR